VLAAELVFVAAAGEDQQRDMHDIDLDGTTARVAITRTQ
jgi:hypothetical protein